MRSYERFTRQEITEAVGDWEQEGYEEAVSLSTLTYTV